MSTFLRRLAFPLLPLKFQHALQAGDTILALEVALKNEVYQGAFTADEKPLKLTLERIDEHEFLRSFLSWYLFRRSDKEVQGPRNFLARIGLGESTALEMTYAEQKYVLTYQVRQDGQPLEVQMFYSPSISRLVVRANRSGR